MSLSVALRLGRVSNLPTVWSNSLTGIVLAGGDPRDPRSGFLLLAFTLFYVAGMFLNDAFDRNIDAVERPERPIPSGQVSSNTVFVAGFAMLVAALAPSYVGRISKYPWHRLATTYRGALPSPNHYPIRLAAQK